MSGNSKIEWTDHTFNPWWGCIRVSAGCENCYAETFAKRVGHKVWGPAKTTERRLFGENHWAEPMRWDVAAQREGVRRRVFCASMADVFEDHPALPPEREKLWSLIGATPFLDWQLLTKRPENVLTMVPYWWHQSRWPENVWIGTTVENQEMADLRIPKLIEIPAAVHFLSCEPLLGPLDLSAWLCPDGMSCKESPWLLNHCCPRNRLQWVIGGGESAGPQERRLVEKCCRAGTPFPPGIGGTKCSLYDAGVCNSRNDWRPTAQGLSWAHSLRDQCQAAGVPFFWKEWGGPTHAAGGRLLDGRTWDEMPETARREVLV